MKITYDRTANAAYIYLCPEIKKGEVSRTYACDPAEVGGQINIDFNEKGELLGIEVLDASRLLNQSITKEAGILLDFFRD